VFIRDVI